MMVSADIKCYYCGYISGTLVGDQCGPIKVKSFQPSDPSWSPRPGETLRCRRCGGPVFLDEVRRLRHQEIWPEGVEEAPIRAIA